MRLMSTPKFLALIAPLVPAWCGCGGSGAGGSDSGEPPVVPPASTLQIDFDDFSGSPPTTEGPRAPKQADSFENWVFAAGNLVVWSTVLTVSLAIPVAAFAESFNHEPQQVSALGWVWSYDVLVNGVRYSAALHGTISGANITWRMLISKEGAYTDFEWFTGVSNLTATQGTWSLSRDPSDATPFVDIAWERSTTDDAAEVRYTNITPEAAGNGSYIVFGITPETPFDAFYEVFGAELDETVRIEWMRSDASGRVRNETHFGNGEWHCWNDQLRDIDCP